MRRGVVLFACLVFGLAVAACHSDHETTFGCKPGATYTCKEYGGDGTRDYTFQPSPEVLCKDRICVPSGQCATGCYYKCPDEAFEWVDYCAKRCSK